MPDKDKESMVFYRSFYEAIRNIPAESQLALYNAIFEYSFNDAVPELNDGIAKAMFILMKANIDSANSRYRASCENGKKGGRPKSEKTQQEPSTNPAQTQSKPNKNLDQTQQEPSTNLNDNDNDNENDNDNDNENDNENENENGDDKKPDKKPKGKPLKPIRHQYGQYKNVLLSDADMEKLKIEFPADWAAWIGRLSEYMESTGRSYKSHLATIRCWAQKDREKARPQQDTRFHHQTAYVPPSGNFLDELD